MKRLLLAGLILASTPAVVRSQADGYTYGVQDRTATGTLGALNAAVTISLEGTPGIGGYVAIGTLSGTITPEVCSDPSCSTWVAVNFLTWSAGSAPARAATITGTTLFQLEVPAGARKARIRVSSYTSGSGTGSLIGTAADGVFLPAAAGGGGGTSSNFGAAFPAAGTAAGFSDGTDMQAGRAVDTDSGGGTVYAQGVNLLKRASGGPVEAGTSADPLRVDPTGTTAQPVTDNGGSLTVDGTITANQGAPAATANRWPVQITDGTDLASVTGTSLDVNCTGGCGGASAFQDEDAFTVGTTPVNIAGYLVDETTPDSAPEDSAAAPRMAPNRVPYAILRDAAGNERGADVTAANALKVDGSAVTQPVSGTVGATQSTSPWVIGDGGGSITVDVSGSVVVTDGAGALTVDGTVTAAQGAPNSTANRWPVQLTDGIDLTAVTAGGELNVLATAQPGVDIGDVTVNNASIPVTQSTSPWVTRDDSSLVDNAGFTPDTSRVLPQGQVLDETAGAALTENDIAASRINANRATIAVLEDDSTRGTANRSVIRAGQSSTTQVRPELAHASLVTSISPNNSGLPVNTPLKIQSSATSSSGSVASLARAFGSNNTAGNTVVVVCGVGNGNTPTMSDTAGNTYTRIANASAPSPSVWIFFAPNIAAGANTVTCTNGGAAASMAIAIYEFSGLLTAAATAQPGIAAANSGNSAIASTSPMSPTGANEWAIAGVVLGTAAQTITPGTGWTNDSGQLNPGTPSVLFSMVSMSQYLESLMPQVTPSATFTSEPWAIAVATLKPVNLPVQGSMHVVFGGPDIGLFGGGVGVAAGKPVVAAVDASGGSFSPGDMTGDTFAPSGLVAYRDDTTPGTLTEDRFGFVRQSGARELYTVTRDAAGNNRGANVTAGNALQTDTTSIAGTAVVTGGVAGSQSIGGVSANDTAITQNPVLVGLQVLSQGTQPTAATSGRQRQQLASTEGVAFTQEGNSNRFSCFIQAATATTQCQAAPGAGLRAYVTSVNFSNQAATVQTLDVVFGTGVACATGITAMTHKWQFGTVATTTSPFEVSVSFPTPLVPTAANAICVRPSAATAFGATLTGFIAP